MKRLIILLNVIMVLGLYSCSKETKNTKQTVEAQQEAKEVEGAEKFTVDTKESKIKWIGETLMKNHFGQISFKEGELNIKEGKLVSGTFTADMNTLKSEDIKDAETAKKLDDHLKDPDFFDVVKYPEAKFTITQVKSLEGEYNSELEGNLQLKETTKNISVKAIIKVDGNKVSFTTEKFSINRQDFNITYSNGSPKDKVINDLFDLEVIVVAEKK